MKKLLIPALVGIAMMFQNNAFAQTKKVCEESVMLQSQKNSKSRGPAMFKVDKAKVAIIPAELVKSRGVGSCYLAVENNTDMDVNVFVDSIYIGYIEPMKKGMIARSNGYQIVHCWSTEGNYKWVKKGDCVNCMKRFVLNVDKTAAK